ncbi:MAG: type I-MYXAN CRISPR-associated protein Cas6/Cmx6 [Acidobacteriota bacterium]|nr:type I-MYXAN CRISPR-associated protein Cas6/Cmx6 [Acidobacteriota bacterium]
MQMETEFAPETTAVNAPHVTVRFPVEGRRLPADHGYALYSAITRLLPAAHAARWLAVELISGVPWREGIIVLPTRGAALYLRLPADHYAAVLPLAGKRLDIDGHPLRLGIPSARPLTPAASLYARTVTIKKFTEPEPFLDAARRQLDTLGITATLELPHDDEGRRRRRVLRIKDKTIVGFSLAAHDLTDADSIKLETLGLGGRRAMGCGIFNPIARGNLTTGEAEK